MTKSPRSLLDALVFSNLWMAAGAGALVAATSRAMEIAIRPDAIGLAFAGTLVVYNIDRLRDQDRDRSAAPDRSAFVARYQRPLSTLTGAAAISSVYLAAHAGWPAIAILLPVLVFGLCHRRLKRFENAKILYVAASWTCVGFGLPAVLTLTVQNWIWVGAILTATMIANVIAFNLREEAVLAERYPRNEALWLARALTAAGVALAACAPSPAKALIAIPLATLLALIAYRPTERFSPLVVDGALLVGALISAALA
jgi:hypothetical protein